MSSKDHTTTSTRRPTFLLVPLRRLAAAGGGGYYDDDDQLQEDEEEQDKQKHKPKKYPRGAQPVQKGKNNYCNAWKPRKYCQFFIYLYSFCFILSPWHRKLFLSLKQKYKTEHATTSSIQAAPPQEVKAMTMTAAKISSNTTGAVTNSTSSIANLASSPNGTTSNNGTYLFIHLGPIKTGTSSIQCNLQANPFLKNSSYEYIGKRERLCAASKWEPLPKKYFKVQNFVFQYILRGWLIQDAHQPYVQFFKKDMKAQHDKGIHTIMSGEEFCAVMMLNNDMFQLFADLLDSLEQNVIFQVVYRNFFEWTLSSYSFNELLKVERNEFKGSSVPSVLSDKIVKRYFDINATASCTPYGLWSYFNSKLPLFHKDVQVHVFNMHQGGGDCNLGTQYICNLPNAEEACEASRREIHCEKSNPSNVDFIHADRIAAAAWENGLFYNSSAVRMKRAQVNEAIKNYVHNQLNSSFSDLPLECLDQMLLNQLFEKSIQHGKEMIGDTINEDHLKEQFYSFISLKKFCSINATAIVLDFQNVDISEENKR